MDYMKIALTVLGLGVGVFIVRKGEKIFSGYIDPYLPEEAKKYNGSLFIFGILLTIFGGKIHSALPNLGMVLMGVGVADILETRFGGEE